ncbi:MAG: hypothetical protein K9K80_02035, partial [Spirochaetia bacterium]|nr:hypothetical protein [Spirochaetia bacterium]
MSTMNFYIDFKGEFGEIDIAPYCLPDLSYTDVYHNTSFKAIKNIMKVTLSDPNGELIKAFSTYADNFISCRLYIDDDLKFRGYIRNNFSTKLSHGYEVIILEAIDIAKDLEKNLPESIELENADICNTADPDNSIIHQLLYKAGWGVVSYYGYSEEDVYGFSDEDAYGYLNVSLDTLIDVPITIDYYFKSRFGDHAIYELVQELLEEAGYCLVVSPDGYPYIDTIISRGAGETDVTLVDKKVFKGFTVNRKSVEYDSVKGKWYEHEFLEEQLVFDEETDGTEEYDCFVPIGDDESYPEGSHEMIGEEYSNVTKLNFDVEDRELIVAKYMNSQVKATLAFNQEGIDWEWAKPRTEDYWYGDSIDQGVHNLYTPSGSTEQILLHLSVVADVIVKGDMHQEIAAVSDLSVKKELEKEFKYITDKTTVETVVQGLLDNYVFGKYTYEFETKEEFTLGAYYQVTEPVYSDTEHPIKITKKESIYKWTKSQGYHLYKYKYTGVSYGAVPYIETTSSRFTSRKPTTPKRKWTEKLQEDFEIDNPYPPYSVGETWEKEDGLYICVTPKDGSESYSEDDWEIYKRTKAGKNAVGYTIYPDGADEDKNKIDIHAVTSYGEPLTEEIGWMFDGDVKIQIPITIGLAVPLGKSYLFSDTASGEIVTVVYDLATDMRLEYTSDGSAIGAGRFIGEVICEDVSGVDTITGVLMFERVKNTAELKEYHKTKVLTAMGEDGVNFAAAADEMGIKNFLTSLAVYTAFINELFVNNITAGDPTGTSGLTFKVHTYDPTTGAYLGDPI